jgi:hypothetical protein
MRRNGGGAGALIIGGISVAEMPLRRGLKLWYFGIRALVLCTENPGWTREDEVGAVVDPAVAGGERHHLRLGDDRAGEVEAG